MRVNEYLSSQGLTPICQDEYYQILKDNFSPLQLENYQRLFSNYSECGDKESTMAFYNFDYGTKLNDGTPLIQLWQRCFGFNFIQSILLRIESFCQETDTAIVDVGCGDGLILGYLALLYPHISFSGIDRMPEAIELAKERIKKLALGNVILYCDDCYQLDSSFESKFDGVIMVNVLDDEREPFSEFIKARFDIKRKMEAILRLLKTKSRVWLSLTPFSDSPESTIEFEKRLRNELRLTGFKERNNPYFIPYSMMGQRHQHMVLILES